MFCIIDIIRVSFDHLKIKATDLGLPIEGVKYDDLAKRVKAMEKLNKQGGTQIILEKAYSRAKAKDARGAKVSVSSKAASSSSMDTEVVQLTIVGAVA